MGQYSVDQYSLLHFAVGIIAYFWGISAITTFILHVIFELAENTEAGMKFINTYITIWPGGKPSADSYTNMAFDTLFTMIGWGISRYVDTISKEHHLYP